jgi:type I restriction enzyme R subunit
MSILNFSEDSLIEQPAIQLFRSLRWEAANCFHEFEQAGGSPLGRETPAEVLLVSRLRPALEKLNRDLPKEAITLAIEEATRDRSTVTAVSANREMYRLLKDGVKVSIRGTGEREEQTVETVKLIDWDEPSRNDFLLASQFWVTGEMYKRRADLVGFVNGIPLVFIELKASHKRLENAYYQNLRDYRNSIPQLFWYNAFIILSNGSQSGVGSTTAEWEHFTEWKKINDEGEEGIVSLETMIRGTCEPVRLLDIIENFTVFEESKRGLIKKVAKNHQYLGVNRVIRALSTVRAVETSRLNVSTTPGHGRLGVFWHTQGSGKSVSMLFFAQNILRKVPGNWTFVIVTDRIELDDQIYKQFAACGAITEEEARATSGEELKRLLTEDHRYVFTLIQKFRTNQGETFPKLSDRSDIIVITDEAHRSQYDTFALNMRNALPNAAFIGFTGTPLMVGEEKTKEVFGDYISIYNFKQSVDDKATVPLYYDNRTPELQLTNENLNEDMERLLEEAELDEEQEKKLEREFAREYHLITRDDRLEKVAEDIVAHFMGRGFQGKAMVVSIDKATTVRMYDKVQKHWKRYLEDLRRKRPSAKPKDRKELDEKIALMTETDMAVVVSQSQNEIEDMKAKGLDIAPHRRRMVKEDLDVKFKDDKDPFRIVFVCAMWMTGFDVPSCSTIYLDKLMRNHTLMQTIARANRVFKDKNNGLIVDYVGVFRNLQKALAIYGSDPRGGLKEGEMPVKDKSALVEELEGAIEEATYFCTERGVILERLRAAEGFERVKLLDDAVEAIILNDELKRRYLSLAASVIRLYKAILPHPTANQFSPVKTLFAVLAEKIYSLTPEADISEVMGTVEGLLDESISSQGYAIAGPRPGFNPDALVDLSKIDFEALRARFESNRRRTEAEKLKSTVSITLKNMIRLNRSRMDYLKRFQEMIDEYNSGSMNVELFFKKLVEFTKELNAEEKRSLAEQLTEEELAIFDLLTKPEITLSKKEEQQVKKVAQSLLETLKREKLVLDWRKRQQSRADVRLCIEETLDRLPPVYDPPLYRQKCDVVYQHVYDSYYGLGRSVYTYVM